MLEHQGKLFFIYFCLFVLSFIGFLIPLLGPIFFAASLIGFGIVTVRRLEYGMYLVLGDLFSTSFGYLFSWYGISLRIGIGMIFLGTALVKLISAIKSRASASIDIPRFKAFLRRNSSMVCLYLCLMAWIIGSFIHGWLRNGFADSFLDGDRYLYLTLIAITPALRIEREKLLRLLGAGLIWLFVFVSFVEIMFSRIAENELVYRFVRDLRFGEITQFVGNFWRIFLQSEIYAIIGLFVAGVALLFQGADTRRNENMFLMFVSVSLLLVSLSRSFWLGTIVALVVGGFFIGKQIASRNVLFGGVRIVGVLIVSVLFVMTISNTFFGGNNLIQSRLDSAEPAASSRSAQLGPLVQAITDSPIVGYGFGKHLEYRSSDPRIVKSTAGGSGKVSTYAFELGWLEMVLKMGVVGAMLYVSLLLTIMGSQYKSFRSRGDLISFALLLSLVALAVVHAFTPYLNHALGIGFLIMAIAVLKDAEECEQSMGQPALPRGVS